MHRNEREITCREQIDDIIRRSQVCRLALSDGMQPYIVPLCFGYQDGRLYFHSAPCGRKIDILRQNPQVCAAFDLDCRIKPASTPCQWGMHYRSVIAFGRAEFIIAADAKARALAIILAQYMSQHMNQEQNPAPATNMTPLQIENTLVFQVTITAIYGKAA